MKLASWQVALCSIVFAASGANALAQQADFAGAARAATGGGEINSFYEKPPAGLLDRRKMAIFNRLPESQRSDFVARIPRSGNDALQYYDVVENCINKRWQNCM